MGIRAGRIAIAAAAAICGAGLPAGDARAANGAYAVDAADISEVGSCKVESWLSAATNTDFSAVANPSCVVESVQAGRIEHADRQVAQRRRLEHHARAEGQDEHRADRHRQARLFVLCRRLVRRVDRGKPHRLRGRAGDLTGFSETMRINLNGGWLWDRRRRPALFHLRRRLRLEVHGHLAMDHRGVRPGRASRTSRAWSGRGFRPACATGRTRFSRST